ncbi:MAG: DNA (cytosine-5-)-methyltransferase [Candidatus Aenigmarchaeota archaeon]|nr:DNA (cytosine-5-)-methyltransferase [Candidatus Aenigmarchaeota archaeon]
MKNKIGNVKEDRHYAAIDLFCGVGAITHGLIKSGIPVIAGIDSDGTCKYAYEKNNKSTFIKEDVRKITGDFLKKLYPKGCTKILVGCAPCQPFSKHTQKNKKRSEDEKWGLLYSFSRLVEEAEPDIISMENVPQIQKQKVFADFVNKLKKLKYQIFYETVYCPDYGIPQSRRRLVLLASKLGEIKLLPKTHKKSNYRTVRDTIYKIESIKSGGKSKNDPLHRASNLSPLNKIRINKSTPGGTWLDWDEELRSPCHRKETGATYTTVYSRMEWDKPSPTITTQFYIFGTGRFGHPEQDRALSLREGALLQTFPKYYKFIDPKSEISSQRLGIHIGNAVPVKLGTVIGKSVIKHLLDKCPNIKYK